MTTKFKILCLSFVKNTFPIPFAPSILSILLTDVRFTPKRIKVESDLPAAPANAFDLKSLGDHLFRFIVPLGKRDYSVLQGDDAFGYSPK